MRSKCNFNFRDGLIGAWCPSISGPTGFTVPNLVPALSPLSLINMAQTDWVISGQGTGDGADVTLQRRYTLNFDGVDSRLESSQASLPFPDFTVTMWCLLDYTNSDNYAVFFEHGYQESFRLSLDKVSLLVPGSPEFGTWENRIILSMKNVKVVNRVINTSGTFFYFIAAVCRYAAGAYSCLLAVNNNFTTTSTTTTSQVDVLRKYFVGGGDPSATSTTSSAGKIDDVRIYNRALTRPELFTLYRGGRGYGLFPVRRRQFYKTKAAFLATNPLVVTQAVKTSYQW